MTTYSKHVSHKRCMAPEAAVNSVVSSHTTSHVWQSPEI